MYSQRCFINKHSYLTCNTPLLQTGTRVSEWPNSALAATSAGSRPAAGDARGVNALAGDRAHEVPVACRTPQGSPNRLGNQVMRTLVANRRRRAIARLRVRLPSVARARSV